jgi:hypothetical protein
MESNGVRFATAAMTIVLLVYSLLKGVLSISTKALTIILIIKLVVTTTITANLATRGCDAPSSFPIRTLVRKSTWHEN